MSVLAPPPFQSFLDIQRDVVWRYLVAIVGPLEAEDCFQETFIAALRAYPRLRPDSDARAWVLTIAHRKALDALRVRARQAAPLDESGQNPAMRDRADRAAQASTRGADEQALARDEGLWQAVAALPPRQRSAVALRFIADLPHSEIATAIGCSEQAARRSLHEGLTKLRKVVEQ